MLLKKILNSDNLYIYVILSMDEFWENKLVLGLDYNQDNPPLLTNTVMINVLSNLEVNDREIYPICFKLKNLKINSLVKLSNNNLITIDLLLPPEEEKLRTHKNHFNDLEKFSSYISNDDYNRYDFEINELVRKVFIEENSLNSRVLKIENSLKEVEESIKQIEDNFFVTRIDTLKGIKRGDWRIIGTIIFIFCVLFYQIAHIQKIEFIFEKLIPLDLPDLKTNTEPEE